VRARRTVEPGAITILALVFHHLRMGWTSATALFVLFPAETELSPCGTSFEVRRANARERDLSHEDAQARHE
jgi:hypothetical protein